MGIAVLSAQKNRLTRYALSSIPGRQSRVPILRQRTEYSAG
ncbi:hypothetical protein HMPREF1600_03703 [Escherichia coli 907715]|uniref:Uncharacterized protein n=1 Tax=Escherichia coli MS 85-1 TaxID=679202 RepID=A0AAN3M535_ECOLX|nr:hypothetical protein HMPREF9350_05320 [Escherichia coli MS 85-1]ESA83265.1 hypothetical protein HMPREF1599_04207 [Escherichia coli 907713]ESD23001.1 hypothetical protein HMPREF1600_03703 [Escherichia coli 907715]ESD52936.1 hypothetical protein HMPREF1606_03560 [Escherichia coli 908522]